METTTEDAMTPEESQATWDGELEHSARVELRKCHIDESMYEIGSIERSDERAVVVFNGVGDDKTKPQASVVFERAQGQWIVQVKIMSVPAQRMEHCSEAPG